MKRYTAMKNDRIVQDEDGCNLSFKAASADDSIVVWMEQKVGELNMGFAKGPHWIKTEEV